MFYCIPTDQKNNLGKIILIHVIIYEVREAKNGKRFVFFDLYIDMKKINVEKVCLNSGIRTLKRVHFLGTKSYLILPRRRTISDESRVIDILVSLIPLSLHHHNKFIFPYHNYRPKFIKMFNPIDINLDKGYNLIKFYLKGRLE